ncbi:YjaG family protein [Orbus wheelerorum]|uniref:YjaG family protein n=1 Tax=Orbus wheelerorum TaxID=3074111 RepID=UPI00370D0AC7
MIKNPIHLRLEKLASWQLKLFMVCLCERMYPNFALYCQQMNNSDDKVYKAIIDLNWESMLVKNAKINFDGQLEKLEEIIPSVDDNSPYSVYPAIDACEALSELVHSYLSGEQLVEHAIAVSRISLKTIIELESAKTGNDLSENELKEYQPILDELDVQWEIYRVLKNEKNQDLELIKGLKNDLREEQISNIGVFLSSQTEKR